MHSRNAQPSAAATEPTATPEHIAALTGRLRHRRRQLQRRSVDSILDRLATVVDRWLADGSPWRREAEEHLARATRHSAEMIRFALPWMLEPLRAPALAQLLDAELGNRRALDGAINGRVAQAPDVMLHVLAGNLPALAAVPIALSLSIKSSALVKAASGDPIFPTLFQRSIAAVDEQLGECIAACYWPGGDRACEERAFAEVTLVVASGDDATIADVRRRSPVPVIGHGHRVSCAVVTAQVLRDTAAVAVAAAGLALDMSVWDQRGCLSPQVCFVEGDFDAACAFALLLAAELAALVARLPPGTKTLEEVAAVRRFRDHAEWQRAGGRSNLLLASDAGLDWTIVVEDEAVFRPTPLCRSLRVLPLRRIDDLGAILAPAHSLLEAVGRVPNGVRCAELDRVLAQAGVHWIVPIGTMQRPSLSWPQGGRPRVADWITWSPQERPRS